MGRPAAEVLLRVAPDTRSVPRPTDSYLNLDAPEAAAFLRGGGGIRLRSIQGEGPETFQGEAEGNAAANANREDEWSHLKKKIKPPSRPAQIIVCEETNQRKLTAKITFGLSEITFWFLI